MIGETGERKSAVATPDGKSRKKKKKNEEEEREWREWVSNPQPSDHVASALSITPRRHPDTRRLTSEGSDKERRQFDRTNKITLNITTRCHHCTLRVTLDTTTNPNPHGPPRTLHRPSHIFTVHLALFADNIHTTPRKPSPTHYGFGANMSDNIRIIRGVTS